MSQTTRRVRSPWRLAMGVVCALAPVAAVAEVTVFAAASLKTALDEIAAQLEADGAPALTRSYGASSALARQIQAGAPADIFVSANVAWMDVLEAEGLVAPGTRRDLLTNRLVLIATAPAPPATFGPDLAARLAEGRLAMALVDAVPAGLYGRAALTELGLWDNLEARVVQSDNVRAALALVALGAVPFGLVYATDARAEPRVDVVSEVPSDSHPPILYPAALISRAPQEARAVLDYLSGPEARAVFERHGFGRPGD